MRKRRGAQARRDVPAWAHELKLVFTLHGMHWTGRGFLDYSAMQDVLHLVTDRLPGRHVLAYLPGWEGRYYWQYGDYRPDPRLGGERGFAKLCEFARERQAHVMPMFGGNCVNHWLHRFRDLDPGTYMKSATGNRFHGNQPDWDYSRAHDTGWQAWLNPGHPGWRETLCEQIEALAAGFGFTESFSTRSMFGSMIRIAPSTTGSAPSYSACASASRACYSRPSTTMMRCYRSSLSFQCAYWGRDRGWTARYVLRFAHLCEAEPEGRTGVHGFGVWKTPATTDYTAALGYLPTLAFQHDTLERSRAQIEATLAMIAAR